MVKTIVNQFLYIKIESVEELEWLYDYVLYNQYQKLEKNNVYFEKKDFPIKLLKENNSRFKSVKKEKADYYIVSNNNLLYKVYLSFLINGKLVTYNLCDYTKEWAVKNYLNNPDEFGQPCCYISSGYSYNKHPEILDRILDAYQYKDKMVHIKFFISQYLDELPKIDEDTFKSIIQMMVTNDIITREIAFKYLLSYNWKEYIVDLIPYLIICNNIFYYSDGKFNWKCVKRHLCGSYRSSVWSYIINIKMDYVYSFINCMCLDSTLNQEAKEKVKDWGENKTRTPIDTFDGEYYISYYK